MKSLATLIKLQKTYVDEQRIHLAKLQERLEKIEHEIMALEIQKAKELVAAEENADARATYGAFLKNAVAKGRELEKVRQVALSAVETARDQLSILYEEQKRYEHAEEARIEAEEKEERRQETIELDEIGGVTHERRKAE